MNYKKYDNIIAIDPDVDKSGVAFLERSTKKMELSTLPFPDLLDYLQFAKKVSVESGQTVVVLVEAGWLIKSNWHLKQGESKRVSSAKGNAAGRNHETGRKIVEMAKHYDLDVEEVYPLKKSWKGKDGKITHEELAYFTGVMGRTNQESRDAALIAWNYAGFPIKITKQSIK